MALVGYADAVDMPSLRRHDPLRLVRLGQDLHLVNMGEGKFFIEATGIAEKPHIPEGIEFFETSRGYILFIEDVTLAEAQDILGF